MRERLPVRQVTSIITGEAHRIVATSVTCAGHGLALVLRRADATRGSAGDAGDSAGADVGGGRHPETPPYPATLVEHDGHSVVRAIELECHLAYPHVQTFPDGGILMVGSRCEQLDDGTTERNAHLYSPDGAMVSQFTAGDGIGHVRVDARGRIWTGYFDEGVYGGDSRHPPIGGPGIVRFERSGEVSWRYQPAARGVWIDDCYALNVGPEEVWTCFYSGFPIVRIKDDDLTIWGNQVTGASALATCGTHVLLVGGYRENAGRAVLLELHDGQAVALREYDLAFPREGELTHAHMLGVNGAVHILSTTGWWYRVDIGDLVPSAR